MRRAGRWSTVWCLVAAICAPGAARADWLKRDKPIAHGIMLPAGYGTVKRKYPLVVVLHANCWQGADHKQLGDTNAVFYGSQVQQKFPSFVLCPQCPGGRDWCDVHWSQGAFSVDQVPISKPVKAITDIMQDMVKEYPIDTSRVYLVGNSMGAQASWDLLARYPKTFAGAVLSAGCGDPSKAPKFKDVAIWAFHGSQDVNLSPASDRATMANLEKAGAKVMRLTDKDPPGVPKAKHIYSEYKCGHHVWSKTAHLNPVIATWLFSQSRPAPKKGKAAKDGEEEEAEPAAEQKPAAAEQPAQP